MIALIMDIPSVKSLEIIIIISCILSSQLRNVNHVFLTFNLLQELKPTMDELGIASLEEMGYDKPELALPNPYEIH